MALALRRAPAMAVPSGVAPAAAAAPPPPRMRRLVIIGFDGQEPSLTDAWIEQGRLPHFARLAQQGCYHRLRTTSPPVSPVAWSSFATGTDPGRHGIFDFIDRDPRTYLPRISSTRIGHATRAILSSARCASRWASR